MFKNIARTLKNIALAACAHAPRSHVPVGKELSAKELAFTGRGKSGKVSHKQGNAAHLKRLSKRANNIRKHN